MRFTMKPAVKRWGGQLLLTLYYLAILVGLVLLYGRGQFTVIDFVYQGY